jgi:hypothetical protein
MSDVTELPIAAAGDAIAGADLQPSIDELLKQAQALDAALIAEADVDRAQAIARTQQGLRSRAQALVNRQIMLLADEVKVGAEHINAATRYAADVIDEVIDVGKKLALLGELIAFFTAVMSGSGKQMLGAANSLKKALDTCAA